MLLFGRQFERRVFLARNLIEKEIKMEKRIRNFAFLIYEDSALENWKEKLESLFVPSLFIYHDQDIDSEGKVKKPHYHVLVMLDTPHGLRRIKKMVSFVGGANDSFCEVANLKGYARYLCHLDNLEKHRYQISEVVSLSGADYEKFIFTESDRIMLVREIIEFCRSNRIYSYARLVDYCLDNNSSWFKILCSFYGRSVRDYIRSFYWEKEINRNP